MSPLQRPKTKQKRPELPYQMVYEPIDLPDSFPVHLQSFFRHDESPITSLHRHDCLELGYCHEGAGVFVIGEKVLTFRTGDVSFISPAEFHYARSMAGIESKWSWVLLDPVRLLQSAHLDPALFATGHLTGKSFCNIVTSEVDPLVGTLMSHLAEELREQKPGYQMTVKGLIWTLMARFTRLAPPSKKHAVAEVNGAISRVGPALDFIAKRYPESLSIREWARSCHASPTHFRRLFRRALGRSPQQYLTELRVRMAATRLHATDEKIVTIANNVGFITLSSFNRAFRQMMKLTPRQWRARR